MTWKGALTRLFPFNRRGRLRRDVVDDAVDAADLVDDPGGDLAEEVVGELDPVGGHAVLALDDADGDGVVVGPLVAHDADAAAGEEDGERLPDLGVPAARLHLLD